MPIRCFTCGKPVAQDWEGYDERIKNGEDIKKIMDSLGYERYCCRRMFLSHSEIIDEIMRHKKY